MKKRFYLFSVISFILVFLPSCGSTKSVPVIPEEQTEEISVQNENPVPESQNSEPEAETETKEEDLSPLSELVSESDLIKNSVETDYAPEFSEPEVQDAPVIEVEVQEDSENTEISENITENITQTETQTPAVITSTPEVSIAPESSASETVLNANNQITEPETKENQPPLTQVPESETENASDNQDKISQSHENLQENDQNQDNSPDIFTNPAVIIPSRSMEVKNNQYIDVVYPGGGWVYIGETEKNPIFSYFGRKLGTGNTTFTLRSRKSGTTYLHFYKNDALTNQYIDDYLKVTVLDEAAKSNEKAVAPSYAEAVPPKPERRFTTVISGENNTENSVQKEITPAPVKKQEVTPKSSEEKEKSISDNRTINDKNVKTVIQTKNEEQEPENNPLPKQIQPAKKASVPAESEKNEIRETDQIDLAPGTSLLEQAKKSLKENKHELALRQIQFYLDNENKKIDEALFVQGQILEADSPVKNIRSAIDCYDSIIKKYPASKYWNNANKRKIFLKRFYVDIY